MFIISKRFNFESAHSLPYLPDGHKCRNLHGHSYSVEIFLKSEHIDKNGFVVDYGELNEFDNFIKACLDHKNLNETLADSCQQTTAETLARYFYGICKQKWSQTFKVIVKETDKTSAEYLDEHE